MNERFSATTEPTVTTLTGNGQSFLVDSNSYYLNNISGLNLGVVNPTNVRAYLNDSANEKIINDFFSYLTGNTNQDQFREIFYNDEKLSNVFNEYYSQSVLSGQQSSVYYINQQLTATTYINYYYSNFNWNGFAPPKYPFTGVTQEIHGATRFTDLLSTITTYTLDESYYIPVYIKKNYADIPRETFDICEQTINLLLNPNNPFSASTSSPSRLPTTQSEESSSGSGSVSLPGGGIPQGGGGGGGLLSRPLDSGSPTSGGGDLLSRPLEGGDSTSPTSGGGLERTPPPEDQTKDTGTTDVTIIFSTPQKK